jgi:hypothetical protein
MRLFEMFQPENQAYQDVSQDNSQPRLGDLRKSKLTLMQINKMRRLNDMRQIEFKEKVERVQTQYAPAPQPMS